MSSGQRLVYSAARLGCSFCYIHITAHRKFMKASYVENLQFFSTSKTQKLKCESLLLYYISRMKEEEEEEERAARAKECAHFSAKGMPLKSTANCFFFP